MAEYFEKPSKPEFSEQVEKFEVTDIGHANVFNKRVERLLQNELALLEMIKNLTPADIDALPLKGGTVTGAVNLDGWSAGLKFIGFPNPGGNARGMTYYDKNGDSVASIGAFLQNGDLVGVYMAADGQGYDASKGLFITKQGAYWKNKKLLTEDDITVSKYTVPKPEVNDVFTEFSIFNVVVKKYGKVVSITFNIEGKMKPVTEFKTLFNLPNEYRPTNSVIHNYTAQNGTPMGLQVDSAGNVNIYNNGNDRNGWLCRQCITYIID